MLDMGKTNLIRLLFFCTFLIKENLVQDDAVSILGRVILELCGWHWKLSRGQFLNKVGLSEKCVAT
jgi:hypothetical protein